MLHRILHAPGPYHWLEEPLLLLPPLTVRRAKTLTAPRCGGQQAQRAESSRVIWDVAGGDFLEKRDDAPSTRQFVDAVRERSIPP